MAQMYVKNIGLALLEMTFQIPPSLLPMSTDNGQLTPRVAQICLFLDQHYNKLSAFDDVKNYVTDLTYGEAKYFLDTMLPKLAADVSFWRDSDVHGYSANLGTKVGEA